LNELGLKAFSAHTGFERLENGIENALKSYKILGLEYVVVPTLPNDRFCKDEDGYLSGTRMLASFGKRMKENGIKFAYHNHAKEFEKFDGKTAMEIVFNESNWEDYLAELDVYWIQNAGGDPEEWLREYRGRMPLVHIKDMGVVSGKPMTMEVGEGNMNMPSIIEACIEARVEWYIIEQDDCLRDPVRSLEISKTYLNKLGVS
jgi:sugar phosphate isomerase/epimerase